MSFQSGSQPQQCQQMGLILITGRARDTNSARHCTDPANLNIYGAYLACMPQMQIAVLEKCYFADIDSIVKGVGTQ